MRDQNDSISFAVDQSPEQVFYAINNAPSPSGTKMESNSSGQRSSSMPIVPDPSAMAGTRPSSISFAPFSSASVFATQCAASKFSPTSPTPAPRRRASGLAFTLANTVIDNPRLRAA